MYVDNGLEFVGNNIQAAGQELGFNIVRLPPRQPWFKGALERFFGTLNAGLVHMLAGTTLENVLARRDHENLGEATYTLAEFNALLCFWICEVYHNGSTKALGPIPGVGGRPLSAWQEKVRQFSVTELPHPDLFMALAGDFEMRTIQNDGIVWDYIKYESPELWALRSDPNHKRRSDGAATRYKIVRDPFDLGHTLKVQQVELLIFDEFDQVFRENDRNLLGFARGLIRKLVDIGTFGIVCSGLLPTYDLLRQDKQITGRGGLPPEERRLRVSALDVFEKRILVATDCLSEGINLQSLFDAVVHYDLSWNPTRHQQREGRVDRYGQKSKIVRSIMLFGENSAIDGAVLSVIIDKAKAIQQATGISVPMPEDNEGVTSALMQALLLKSSTPRAQLSFDFGAAAQRFEVKWRDAEENAKASRARYAQGRLKPEEVLPEWQKMRALNGGADEVARFTKRALSRVGADLGKRGNHNVVHFDPLPQTLKDRLESRGFKGSRAITFTDDPVPDVMYVGRAHPLVAALAESMTEGALDPQSASFKPLGRTGAWRTHAVSQLTTLLVMRLRFKLVTSGRLNRLMLAEEATCLAFSGTGTNLLAKGPDALALLEPEASGNLDPTAIERQVVRALERYPTYGDAIAEFAAERAAVLSDDHLRLTEAARGGATVEVQSVLPADIIGIYVLLPEGE